MRSLFIAPLTSEQWFNQQAEALGNGGPALVMCLSVTGTAPATHGWCGVGLNAEQEAQVQALLDANPDKLVVWRRYNLRTEPGYPNRLLTALGLKRIQPTQP